MTFKFWVCGLALISGCSSFEFGFWRFGFVLCGFSGLANLATECVVWCWYKMSLVILVFWVDFSCLGWDFPDFCGFGLGLTSACSILEFGYFRYFDAGDLCVFCGLAILTAGQGVWAGMRRDFG